MSNGMEPIKKQIKENVQLLIDDNKLNEALNLIEEYSKINSEDIEIYSMRAIILIMQQKVDEAEKVLKDGLNIDGKNFDLNYNLAYLYEQNHKFSYALKCYKKALENCNDKNIKADIAITIEKISSEHSIMSIDDKKKIVFFVKTGMDSFLEDIISGLSDEYETKKIIVTDLKQIDEGMKWADICWFEWCDELVAYGSKLDLVREKKVICRLHSYEAFAGYPSNVNWDNVDKIVFVGENIRKFTIDKYKINENKTILIPNGVNINEYIFKERKSGFNIAYVGYINYKKGPMLLLNTFKAVYDKDNRYKLYIAGEFQDDRDVLYFQQMIKEFGIEKNVFFEGWQDNLDKWLENKDYILCTSILESQNMSVMQAMCKGIKPIVHNFVGARGVYYDKYIWNTIGEAVEMIISKDYSSDEYRKFITDKYSLEKQMYKIKEEIQALINPNILLDQFNEKYGTCFSKIEEYYLKSKENISFFMNPWNNFEFISDICCEEFILQQTQNQFKYINEMYFNGNNDINNYGMYYLYLLKLLQTKFFINEKEIQNLLNEINKEKALNINLVEKTIFTLYTILKRKIEKIENKKYCDCEVLEIYNNKYFNNDDKLVELTYRKLYETLKPIQKYIKTFFIHGSLSTMDYTEYSDVDTQLVLKHEVFSSISVMRKCRKYISQASVHLFEYDQIQHHSFFIISEIDLDYYPQSFLPVELLQYSTLIHGDAKFQVNIRSSLIENMYAIWSMSYGFRQTFINKGFPNDMFSLKRYTSRLMLLPTLYLELFYETYPYKRDSFDLAKKYFSDDAWKAIEIATALRKKWISKNNIELNQKFYYHAWKFGEECIEHIFDIDIISKCNELISGGKK